ncbi:MAG TPA: cupin domain-containing protein [Nocardioidaceae bacterium]|jgi:quercetin dioxygenase-like cupin family protein|nr:cupin domain-containing protein [Nocardioidaceae bacterium]
MTAPATVVHEGRTLLEGPLGAVLLAGAPATGGRCTVVIHPLAPRSLGSPVHTHRNEDEWTYVLEGEIGVELGSETHTAQPGDLILKPRNVPHAFWNGTDEPARLLEIITPGGFEGYFERLGDLLAGGGPPDLAAVAELASEYALEMQPDSIGRLAQAHRLHLPG